MTRPIVMIVEDNPITRKMVTFALENSTWKTRAPFVTFFLQAVEHLARRPALPQAP